MSAGSGQPPVPETPAEAFDELSDIQELVLRRRERGETPADAALWARVLRLREVLRRLIPAYRDDPEAAFLLSDTRMTLELLMNTLPEP